MMARKAMCSFILAAGAMLALLPSCKDEAKEPLVYSTIHEAAQKGNLADVKRHLARGVAVNAKDDAGRTPLHCAAEEGHKDVVEYLVSKGADVNARGADGYTPLRLAKKSGGWELPDKTGARAPVARSAYVPEEGREALKDVVDFLKKNGAKE